MCSSCRKRCMAPSTARTRGSSTLQQILVDKLGFNVIHSDASLYVYCNETDFVLLPFHVDDGTFGSSSNALSLRLIDELSCHFELHGLGPMTFMVGIAIRQDHATGRVELHQPLYIRDQLARFGMADCSTVTTPMTAGLCLTKPNAAQLNAEHEFMANVPYASAVGTLLYLAMCTRPNIAYAVSGSLSLPGVPCARTHWDAVKHLCSLRAGNQGPAPGLSPRRFRHKVTVRCIQQR